MKPLGSYINGNYRVTLFDDGTKIRSNRLDNLTPSKPESMDILITKRCDLGCPMCHEDATPDGQHGDILHIPFLDTLLPYTELAIGGGNPLSHPQLIPFLRLCKSKSLIANLTVHQRHFCENIDQILRLVGEGLLHGIGVSVVEANEDTMHHLRQVPNAVVHVINGVIEIDQLRRLYDQNLKLLILGYKDFRRGATAHSACTDGRMRALYQELPELTNHFKVTSFDNLAIQQLNPRRLLSAEAWDECYMGDDGQYTMYIDMVNRQFAKSSTSTERWPLMDDIQPMFDRVRAS